MRFPLYITALAGLIGALAGCDDPTRGQLPAVPVEDSVVIAVPTQANAGLPSAVDVTVQGVFQGGRFPERLAEAEHWDFALRQRGDTLVLAPAQVIGLNNRAGITAPTNQTYQAATEVPSGAKFLTDQAVVLSEGAVHFFRSRVIADPLFPTCQQYGKLQVVALDAEAGTAKLRITTNRTCFDLRLVAKD